MSAGPPARIRGATVAAGGAAALCLWTSAFRGRRRFWAKMAAGVGGLGVYSLAVNPDLRRADVRAGDVVAGLASAAGLYAIFQAGDRFARRVMPHGGRDIEAIYGKRTLASTPAIAGALLVLIAPGEELFWRGLVNAYLQQRLGRVRGSAAGAALYGAIHLVSGNLTLSGAAGVAGAYWSLQHLRSPRMAPLIVSHAAWDVVIFLGRPTS